ncbi:hypothetical protein MF271_21885 (plasmid) [Deinococcus sp. KNUC1210]|uniref:hypothetical protein n=1 Tax=Deinococcus sp. KNUC1210 TaxID=2917691 RepID=UPI001EF0F442|nr:hypothetical protein [Deinococcus sp. KNUC1210]ULH18131.1 hypothetical protein MF271_21885 [Deinococcus sp. KNUC1210]
MRKTPNPKTDLSGLMGAATRAREIDRTRTDTSTLVSQDTQISPPQDLKVQEHQDANVLEHQNIATPMPQPEKRVNVSVPDSLHRVLRIYSVKSGRQVRDVVADAISRYLTEIGELEK